uniref:Uncharacterized protein n=1 Tax=Pseudo-nitzschia australis TaxID=44445 RepID=A0A7S4A9A4_9STRA
MVEFTTLLSHTFRKLQIRGEIALLDRESTNRQRAFGVELYDLIETQRQAKDTVKKEAQQDGNENRDEAVVAAVADNIENAFQHIEKDIREPLEACRTQIESMKESTPIKFPPILLQLQKEQFGVAIWPIVSQPQWIHECLKKDLETAVAVSSSPENDDGEGDCNKSKNKSGFDDKALGLIMTKAVKGVISGTKTTIAKAIGKLSPKERELEACVDQAKNDMALLEEKRRQKYAEIERLVMGGTTLECF